jgi:ribosomal-protein-alanine N-acetyltransferase
MSNTRAQRIYECHGFRRVAERKGYYPSAAGKREDALVMSLKL